MTRLALACATLMAGVTLAPSVEARPYGGGFRGIGYGGGFRGAGLGGARVGGVVAIVGTGTAAAMVATGLRPAWVLDWLPRQSGHRITPIPTMAATAALTATVTHRLATPATATAHSITAADTDWLGPRHLYAEVEGAT
jgi:hypothetical protein